MNNRFWGVWKTGEANTLTEWLVKCLKGDFDFPFLFQGLAVLVSLCVHPQPLCVPQGHQEMAPGY